jgi:hypothetical protein
MSTTESASAVTISVEPLRRLSSAVGARIRFARAARVGASLGAIGVVGVAVAVTVDRVVGLPHHALATTVCVGIGAPLLGAIASAGRRIPALLPASLIDRAHALSGRVSIALELAATAPTDPLSQLAIADAVGRSASIDAARAFPVRPPKHLRALVLALSALLVATTLERPRVVAPPTTAVATPQLEALLVHPDDLEARRDAVERIQAGPSPTEELRQAIDDTNELLEALSDRTLDRTEAMRRIAALEESLARPRPPSLVAREEALEAMGDRLGRGELTSALAEALRESDAAGAADALRTLADRARESDMSAAERRALREALRELAAMHETEEQQAEQRDAEEALADAERQPESEERESLLQRRREELERLREQHEQRMQAQRELERLQRELDEAAEQLGGEMQDDQAAESMDEAAEDLNRTAREQMSEQEMQELREQLQQLREMIRRQRRGVVDGGGEGEGEGRPGGGGSHSGSSQMDRFVLRARGGSEGSEGVSIGERTGGGASGEGESEGSGGEGGEDSHGTPGASSGTGAGEEGEGGQGEETGERMLVLGEGGDATLELPGFGQGHGPPTGGGEGEDGTGDGAGSGHDDAPSGDPTDRHGETRTVTVHGEDQGRGPSRSEVIRGGAARGFASRDYERVYADYAQHAEEEIEEDEIPPGYRFYVRRYFELIRPR